MALHFPTSRIEPVSRSEPVQRLYDAAPSHYNRRGGQSEAVREEPSAGEREGLALASESVRSSQSESP